MEVDSDKVVLDSPSVDPALAVEGCGTSRPHDGTSHVERNSSTTAQSSRDDAVSKDTCRLNTVSEDTDSTNCQPACATIPHEKQNVTPGDGVGDSKAVPTMATDVTVDVRALCEGGTTEGLSSEHHQQSEVVTTHTGTPPGAVDVSTENREPQGPGTSATDGVNPVVPSVKEGDINMEVVPGDSQLTEGVTCEEEDRTRPTGDEDEMQTDFK